MIPIFYTRYKNAPLSTFISLLSSGCYIIAIFFCFGYFLNLDGMREEVALGETVLMAAIFVIMGIVGNKCAGGLAARKQRKLAENAMGTPPADARSASGTRTDSGMFCPKCGAGTEPGDAFCIHCGAKL